MNPSLLKFRNHQSETRKRHRMGITHRIRRALRGEVSARAALLEASRRAVIEVRRRRERAALSRRPANGPGQQARLAPAFERADGAELLSHFRARESPRFFPGFDAAESEAGRAWLSQNHGLPSESERSGGLLEPGCSGGILEEARAVIAHEWPLLGYGVLSFGEEIEWLREPVSGARWPLEYHGDVALVRGDGSDVRVLWELNRLGHLVVLGRAYVASRDEEFAEEFFAQIESWRAQNPEGLGPNWACAMEVSLRAMNLLAAFRLMRGSRALDEGRLSSLLALFDAHGRHVRRNLEFSYISTGNHYLSDVAGLLWLGICLPELSEAGAWRAFALRELLRELDKQVLPDGADCEVSTGYHRFVTELFLYSFLLCRANGIEVEERHWRRLRSMLEYVRAYLRPEGRAPLVGDADGGQALSLVRRDADDHAYLVALGAALFREPHFKVSEPPPEELFWLLGTEGLRAYSELETAGARSSESAVFEHAGVCVLREGDLYLMLSASGTGLGGRGAHGHNDALAVEVSACGVNFISDPGTYIYTSDARARQLFRSTGYHSTVEVDGAEQNTTSADTPFIIGDEARPRVVGFAKSAGRDFAAAVHHGYERLRSGPVTHHRAVLFDKRQRYWLVEDTLEGEGEHDLRFVFHAAPGRSVRAHDIAAVELFDEGSANEESAVEISDEGTGARLVVASLGGCGGVKLEQRWSSRAYGSKVETVAACWMLRALLPFKARWLLLPVCAGEDAGARLELVKGLRRKAGELQACASLIDAL